MKNHHLQQPETIPKKPPNSIPRPPPLSVSMDPVREIRPEYKLQMDPSESPNSPLQSDSPLRSDEPDKSSTKNGAIVAVEKYYSPLTSPLPVSPPKDAAAPDNSPLPHSSYAHHVINFNRREEMPPQSGVVLGGGERKERVGSGLGSRFARSSKKEEFVRKGALGLRVFEILCCLVSFSVMASDKTQGWSGDSFDRYKEYRFCLAVTIFGFVYSGFQAYDVAYNLATGKHVITHQLRCQFDFIMDQIIAYLLVSASSAAASRVDDWQSNWGKDEFTEKASASVSMAFLAFIAFAISSLISGYNLFNRDLS